MGTAQEDARNQLERSTKMFLVSTEKFHKGFQETQDDPAARQKVLSDWSRTIFAVDEAVIADHGDDKPRVKLTGDAQVYGYRPLGTKTRLETPFKREAAARLVAGGRNWSSRLTRIICGWRRRYQARRGPGAVPNAISPRWRLRGRHEQEPDSRFAQCLYPDV